MFESSSVCVYIYIYIYNGLKKTSVPSWRLSAVKVIDADKMNPAFFKSILESLQGKYEHQFLSNRVVLLKIYVQFKIKRVSQLQVDE